MFPWKKKVNVSPVTNSYGPPDITTVPFEYVRPASPVSTRVFVNDTPPEFPELTQLSYDAPPVPVTPVTPRPSTVNPLILLSGSLAPPGIIKSAFVNEVPAVSMLIVVPGEIIYVIPLIDWLYKERDCENIMVIPCVIYPVNPFVYASLFVADPITVPPVVVYVQYLVSVYSAYDAVVPPRNPPSGVGKPPMLLLPPPPPVPPVTPAPPPGTMIFSIPPKVITSAFPPPLAPPYPPVHPNVVVPATVNSYSP